MSPMGTGTGLPATPALTLDRVIGQTTLHNSALAVNLVTGDVAYAAGCVVVIYQPRRNRQFRYYRASKTVSCLAFSRDGTMLAVGERGHQPSIVVWNMATGAVLAELKGGHKFGVSCLAFSPSGHFIASAGFLHDKMLQVWDLRPAMLSFGVSSGESVEVTPARVGCARLSLKVRSIDFSHDGTYFVTCGDRHIKFWSMGHLLAEYEGSPPQVHIDGVPCLEGTPASILESHKNSIFMDVACSWGEGSKGNVYSVTSQGVLCVFSKARMMEQWVSLEITSASGLSLYENTLAVACSNGVVRLFSADSLKYITTLPMPPPLGKANITSLLELQQMTSASIQTSVNGANDGSNAVSTLLYPAALGVRLSPTGTKVVAVYSDRSMFIWDIADPHNVGKYRSFLNHSACIWDVQCIPSCPIPGRQGAVPDGSIVTCSADNTVRVWDLGALEARTDQENRTCKWANIYSKHVIRVLYANSAEGTSEDPSAPDTTINNSHNTTNGTGEKSNHTSINNVNNQQNSSIGEDIKAETFSFSDGIPDPESPPKHDSKATPRSLAVHPSGLEVACGDKQGNIRIFDLDTMKLKHMQLAHDGEVLCMSYCPYMLPQTPADDHPADSDKASGPWVAVGPRESSLLSQDSNTTPLVLLASASRDRLVHVFEATGGGGGEGYSLLQTMDNHSSSVTAIKFSKDGRRLVSTGGDKMLILNHVHGRQVVRYKSVSVSHGTIYGLDVDPTNKYLVTAGQDKKLNIWNIASGRHTRAYKPDGSGSGELYKVDLDPAGIYAATCSFDKWIRLFDFYSGKCLAKVTGHSELVTGVRFTQDGKRLISIGGDGCIFVWRLSAELQRAMQDRLGEMYPTLHSQVSVSADGPPTEEGVMGGTGGQSHTTADSDRLVEARAKAKLEAKARLKLRSSQVPSWAQTAKVVDQMAKPNGGEILPGAPLQGRTDGVMPPPPPTQAQLANAAISSDGSSARPSSRWALRREKAGEHAPLQGMQRPEEADAGGEERYEDDFEEIEETSPLKPSVPQESSPEKSVPEEISPIKPSGPQEISPVKLLGKENTPLKPLAPSLEVSPLRELDARGLDSKETDEDSEEAIMYASVNDFIVPSVLGVNKGAVDAASSGVDGTSAAIVNKKNVNMNETPGISAEEGEEENDANWQAYEKKILEGEEKWWGDHMRELEASEGDELPSVPALQANALRESISHSYFKSSAAVGIHKQPPIHVPISISPSPANTPHGDSEDDFATPPFRENKEKPKERSSREHSREDFSPPRGGEEDQDLPAGGPLPSSRGTPIGSHMRREKRKETENAVERMRVRLAAMGILSDAANIPPPPPTTNMDAHTSIHTPPPKPPIPPVSQRTATPPTSLPIANVTSHDSVKFLAAETSMTDSSAFDSIGVRDSSVLGTPRQKKALPRRSVEYERVLRNLALAAEEASSMYQELIDAHEEDDIIDNDDVHIHAEQPFHGEEALQVEDPAVLLDCFRQSFSSVSGLLANNLAASGTGSRVSSIQSPAPPGIGGLWGARDRDRDRSSLHRSMDGANSTGTLDSVAAADVEGILERYSERLVNILEKKFEMKRSTNLTAEIADAT